MVKKIAITGGKGGTGKSTIATALSYELSKNNKTLLVDLDVDCPNDHLILNIDRKFEKKVKQMVPKWDQSYCDKCGKCGEVCKFSAIAIVKNKYPIFVPEQCSGCGACIIACPNDAIERSEKDIGAIYSGKKDDLNFLSGELKPGEAISEFVVDNVKELINESEYDYVVRDTAAGTHCDVISALEGSDEVFVVTEPTPLGKHDLELILQLLEKLKMKGKIIINRSDIGDEEIVKEVCSKYDSKIVAEVPYDKKILESYSKGDPIGHKEIKKIAEEVSK